MSGPGYTSIPGIGDSVSHDEDISVSPYSSLTSTRKKSQPQLPGPLTSPVTVVFERQSSVTSTITEKDPQSTEDEGKPKKKLFGNRRDVIILFSVSLFYFSVMCAYSMIAPFFPGEAKKKKSGGTVTGLIFAAFPMVVFVISPAVGLIIPRIGPKFVLIAGLLIEGGTQICFGFVDLMPDGEIFIIFCFLIRIVMGIGSSCTATASLTIIAQNFQHNLATAMGFLETCGGIGMMAGPPIGGFLYSIGGFKLPFLALGCVILICMVVIYFVLPPDADNDKLSGKSGSILRTLRIPGITMVAILIGIGGMVLSFLDPTLQNHFLPFHLSSGSVGLMFLIAPGLFTFLAPVFGSLADKGDTRLMMVVGSVITTVGYVFLGPAPFLKGVKRTLWLDGISLAIIGIGVTPIIIPSLPDMTRTALRGGLPNDITTLSVLSGIFNAMFNIGAIIGPTAGGALQQYFSFEWASTILAAILVLWGVTLWIFTKIDSRRKKHEINSETEPLLKHDTNNETETLPANA